MRPLMCAVFAACAAAGCGDNVGGPATDILLAPPSELRAVSVDSTHVRLEWTASTNTAAGDFAGYVVSWGSVNDSLPKTTLLYLAGPLPSGATQFSVRSRKTNTQTSDPVRITWAPANRYDSPPLMMQEQNGSAPGPNSGLDVGTRTAFPFVGVLDPLTQQNLDFVLNGQGGQPLQLTSASQFSTTWNLTLFSTVTTPNASLESSLTAFPPDATFLLQVIPVVDSTVLYARVQVDVAEFHYVRVHVRVLSGVFPNRSVEVRLSLQRVSGLPFANARNERRGLPMCARLFMP